MTVSQNGSAGKKPYELRRPGGGPQDARRIFNVPGVVLWIAIITIIAFFALGVVPARLARMIEFAGAVSPYRFIHGLEGAGVLSMVSPLFTHMLLHANLPHLAFNMLWLFAFGAPVARRMGAEGAFQSVSRFSGASMFIIFYALCGAAGALIFIAFHSSEVTYLIGASGGVYGLFGAVARFAFNRASLFGPEQGPIGPLLSKPVLVWSAVAIVPNIAIGAFGFEFLTGGANIAWEAHIGGFLFGLVMYPVFEQMTRLTR